jgi:hypothetical protein
LSPPFVGHTVTKWIMLKFLPQSCSLKALPGNSDSSSSVRWLHLEFRLIFHRCFQNTQGTQYFCYQILPCIRNTCLFPECNWNTVSNFIILRNAPPKYTRNTLEIKKNIEKLTLTSAMSFDFFCNPSNASLGLLWLLLSRVSGEVDASSSRRTRLSQCDGIYLRIQWKDVKGCERMWKDVKGCETTSGPQEMWC